MKTEIYDYGMNGEGISSVDGKIVMIFGSLVGENVDFEIVEDNKNYSIGKLKSISSSSENRQTPKCPYFYECGGCDLQHMKYDEQLKFKKSLIKKTIKKISNIDVLVSETVGCSSQFEYRNKSSFNFSNDKAGFFKKQSKDVVNVDKCLISNHIINDVLQFFVEFLNNNRQIKKFVKHLVIRHINDQTLVGVVTKKEIDLSLCFELLQKKFKNIGMVEIINTRNDSVVLSGKIKHVGGIENIEISNFGVTYFVDLFGFHQTNLEIQNKLYEKILEYISSESIVVNGFSGQGLLSAILASKAKKVFGIEINKSSHSSAESLKKQNYIKNMQNIHGDFGKVFKDLKQKADYLILDPSKKGCGEKIMNEIVGIENIIYVSCNPIALAKDLRTLTNDYTIEEIIPFDMFPNTKNVETLVKLKLKK